MHCRKLSLPLCRAERVRRNQVWLFEPSYSKNPYRVVPSSRCGFFYPRFGRLPRVSEIPRGSNRHRCFRFRRAVCAQPLGGRFLRKQRGKRGFAKAARIRRGRGTDRLEVLRRWMHTVFPEPSGCIGTDSAKWATDRPTEVTSTTR